VFIDRVRLNVRGGNGGAGAASFERRKGKIGGRADGGTGGRGGDVIARADEGVATLAAYYRRPHWKAGSGTHGAGRLQHGRNGDGIVIPVPLGTLVYDEENVLIADLVEAGAEVTVARGGRGGRGNTEFVTRVRRAPSFAEQGEYGQERWITLELKLLADAALIGYPNAGKSTLISRVSAARPKVAEYPFTTLEPHLGVVVVDDRDFVLADIPGLIEGAAEGKGLGHEFLRHTERARALVILLDPSPLQVETPQAQHRVLLGELGRHEQALLERPRVVALNKTDVLGEAARSEIEAWAATEGIVLHGISAVTGDGVDRLLHAVADAVDRARREAPAREGFILHRPVPAGFTVLRGDDAWVVEGLGAERAVNLDDLTNPQAAALAARRLRRLGVDDALRDAGAEPGDDVRIGTVTFTFHPEPEADDEHGVGAGVEHDGIEDDGLEDDGLEDEGIEEVEE
jgi:GTP-binding protein